MSEKIKKIANADELQREMIVGARSLLQFDNGKNGDKVLSRLNDINNQAGDSILSAEQIRAVYNEAVDDAKTPISYAYSRPLTECRSRPIEWLIDDYIPADAVTLIAGDGGTGKSTLARNIITAVATGDKQSIFGPVNQKGNVLYYSAEDDLEPVVVPQLEAAGAELKNVFCLGAKFMPQCTFDSQLLKDDIRKRRPVLVVCDPLQSFLRDNVNMASRNQMRRALSPLKILAQRYHTTFLILMHTNKSKKVSGRARVADSSDIWDYARSVIIVGKTCSMAENGKSIQYASLEKANYTAVETTPTILFTIDDCQTNLYGTSNKKDADYISTDGSSPRVAPKLEDAEQAIVNYIKENSDEVPTKDLDQFLIEKGFSRATIWRAKKELKESEIIRYRTEGNGRNGQPKIWYTRLIKSGSDSYTYEEHQQTKKEVAEYKQNQIVIEVDDCKPAVAEM